MLPSVPKENLAYSGLLRVSASSSLHLIEGEEGDSSYKGEE